MHTKKDLKIFVINLKRSVNRRADIGSKLQKQQILFQFFDAIDGRLEKHVLFERYNKQLALRHHGFELTPGELGCYASHFLLWQECASSEEPMLIMEDDIALGPQFKAALAIAEKHVESYGLIRFSGHKPRKFAVCKECEEGMDIVRFKRGPHGASSYAISPAAARKLIEHAQVWFEPVDVHLDRFWTHGVGSFGIYPFSVTHTATSAAQSEIWQGIARGSRSAEFRRESRFIRLRETFGRYIANLPYTGRWQR